MYFNASLARREERLGFFHTPSPHRRICTETTLACSARVLQAIYSPTSNRAVLPIETKLPMHRSPWKTDHGKALRLGNNLNEAKR